LLINKEPAGDPKIRVIFRSFIKMIIDSLLFANSWLQFYDKASNWLEFCQYDPIYPDLNNLCKSCIYKVYNILVLAYKPQQEKDNDLDNRYHRRDNFSGGWILYV
jgi:hypothetical protein